MWDINFKRKILSCICVWAIVPLLISCRKECTTKSLDKFACGVGLVYVPETRYIHKYGSWVANNKVTVINDLVSYKNEFPNEHDSMPFGFINFATQSLIGVNVRSGAGSGVTSQGGLCFDPKTSKWLFQMEYTVSNQCKGSGIYTMDFTGILICPKLPGGAIIEFDARNINPL